MLEDTELIKKLEKEWGGLVRAGRMPIFYKIGGEYHYSEFTNEISRDSYLGCFHFKLSLPEKPIIEFEKVNTYYLFFKKTKYQLSLRGPTDYMYFNKEGIAILEEEDLRDFYLIIQTPASNFSRSMDNCYDFHFFHNCELLYVIKNATHLIYDKYNFDINNIRFARKKSEKEIRGSDIWKRIDEVEKRESKEKMLQFKYKCESFLEYKHLLNSYCYNNDIPVDSPSLLWNDQRVVKWKCRYGHIWEQAVNDRTKLPIHYDVDECPYCKKIRQNENLSELLTKAKQIMRKIQGGQHFLRGYEKEDKLIKCKLKHPINKYSSIAFYLAKSALQTTQISFDSFEIIFSSKQLELMFLFYTCCKFLYLDHVEEYEDNLREVMDFLSLYSLDKILYDTYRKIEHFYSEYQANNNILKVIDQVFQTQRRTNENYKDQLNQIYIRMIEENEDVVKWKSERKLYLLVKSIFNEAIFQYKANWLGLQSLDVFIPSKKIAFEYQGQQHFEPIDFFGGEDSLESNLRRDRQKKEKCGKENVTLIEWHWTEDINKEKLLEKLALIDEL